MSLQKSPRLEIPKLLRLANGMPCQGCGRQDGTVVMAHSNSSIHGKSKGMKAHDIFTAALCANCHSWLDFGTDMRGQYMATREDKLEFFRRAMEATMLYLWRNGLVVVNE
ncbi:MAG TPA: hypothetical protein VMV70_06160 [Gallionella sp.]|nr:hypothetical protein [Gallionella sp.]